tara:strand:- start:54 stop:278 length:225 start_codon:yes stop_codon:yes gene_type:complete
MNDALRSDGLAFAETVGFQQQDTMARLMELVEHPQTGGTTAEDQDVESKGGGFHEVHILDAGCPSVKMAVWSDI